MKEREFEFDGLKEHDRPTLNQFAAAVCGTPLIASILAAEILRKVDKTSGSSGFDWAASSPLGEE